MDDTYRYLIFLNFKAFSLMIGVLQIQWSAIMTQSNNVRYYKHN